MSIMWIKKNNLQVKMSLHSIVEFFLKNVSRWFYWNFGKKYWKVAKTLSNQKLLKRALFVLHSDNRVYQMQINKNIKF